jgi:hypothetical protein
MCIACWTPKATNTHSENVILTALLQQWLTKRTSMFLMVNPVLLVIITNLLNTFIVPSLYVEGAVSMTQVSEGLLIYLLVASNFLSPVVNYGHLCTKVTFCVYVFGLFRDYFYFSASGPTFRRVFVVLRLYVGVT